MIAPEDEAVFMQKVRSLLANPVHCQHMGVRGRNYAQNNWSAAKQAERMVIFYADLVAVHAKAKKPDENHQAILNEF